MSRMVPALMIAGILGALLGDRVSDDPPPPEGPDWKDILFWSVLGLVILATGVGGIVALLT